MLRDPGALIAALPVLSGAAPVRRLGGSEASDSWLLEGPDGSLMLRIDRPLVAKLGLDRAAEFVVLQTAFGAGLGPEPLFADPAEGILVTRFLPGEQWRPEDLQDPGRLAQLGRLLHRVHDLPATGRVFEPVAIAEHYARAAGLADTHCQVEAVALLAKELYPPGVPACVCHGDPNAANIIGARRPRLIDWEYTAVGDPLFDLAVVTRFHRLGTKQAAILLDAWSGRTGGEEFERLLAFMRMYDLLTDLWQRVVSRHGRSAPAF